MDVSMSSTVAASETTSCYEQGYINPVGYDLEKVNSSLVAGKQAPENHGSDMAAEKPAQNVTSEPVERWRQDLEQRDPPSSTDTFSSTISVEPKPHYTVEVLARRDDIDLMKPWKRYIYFSSCFSSVAALASYGLYFGLRIHFTLRAQHAYHRVFPAAWIFIAIEIGIAIPIMFHSLWSVYVVKPRRRKKMRLRGDVVPTVDVLITCCGEDVDLILNTTRAACSIDYPADAFRVMVLDDGRSRSLKRAVHALRWKYPNLYYRSRRRVAGVPHHFKAGNLNYGLEQTMGLKGGRAEFVAALDADMIPEPHWLRAILPHMLLDKQCALACPPQLFYNTPPDDPLYQSLDFFVHVSESIKDACGVAWCTGSGYVVRRRALDDIGQIPTGSVAEDVLTSTLLLGLGWKTTFVHEPLQYGTVPDSYGSHIKQRTRWTVGTMQTALRLRFCLGGSEIRSLTMYQRVSGFMYAIACLSNVLLTVSLFAMPAVLISGGQMIAYANEMDLRWLVRSCWLALICNRFNELVTFLPAGYRMGQRGSRALLWMAPYHTITLLTVFLLPRGFGGRTTSFKPSGSLSSELEERNPRYRAPLFRRLKVILWNYSGGLHLLYILFAIAAVAVSTARCVFGKEGVREQLLCLLTHAFWPPVSWLVSVSAMWTPVLYAIWPPKVGEMEELLERREHGGAAYPKQGSKKIRNGWLHHFFEVQYSLMTAYTTVIFFGTWWV